MRIELRRDLCNETIGFSQNLGLEMGIGPRHQIQSYALKIILNKFHCLNYLTCAMKLCAQCYLLPVTSHDIEIIFKFQKRVLIFVNSS